MSASGRLRPEADSLRDRAPSLNRLATQRALDLAVVNEASISRVRGPMTGKPQTMNQGTPLVRIEVSEAVRISAA